MSASEAQDRTSAVPSPTSEAHDPDDLPRKAVKKEPTDAKMVKETQLDGGQEQEVMDLCGDSDGDSQASDTTVAEQIENIVIHVLCPELMESEGGAGGARVADLTVASTLTALKLLKFVARLTKVPLEEMRLYYNDVHIDDEDTLVSAGISNGAPLKVERGYYSPHF
jgi:hypothetical protein